MLFQRSDWTLFRSLDTLGQRAGVPRERLGAIVAKELADNALDAGSADVSISRFEEGGVVGFRVEDDGDGIPGTDEQIAAMFSIARPLTSSKLLRLPTRGALGNGLRVVVGAVLATGGRLSVRTRGRTLRLSPQFHSGATLVASREEDPYKRAGTLIEVVLGDAVRVDFTLAELAIAMRGEKTYSGRTSPHWYSLPAFRELVSAAPADARMSDLLAKFDAPRGKRASIPQFDSVPIGQMTDADVRTVYQALVGSVSAPTPAKLGCVGREAGPYEAYAKEVGTYEHSEATLPCVVEVWADRTDFYGDVRVLVNRTPVVSQVRHRVVKDGAKARGAIVGCGLNHFVNTGKLAYNAVINVQVPYMAVTNDGKEPDLKPLFSIIEAAFAKACRVAKRLNPAAKAARAWGEKPASKKDLVERYLDAAIDRVSGGGKQRYSLRRLYYAMRSPSMVGTDLEYGYFCRVVGDIENARGGDLPGIYRDDRGALHHPHTGEVVNLGTRAVEGYKRPKLTFNKVLYVEKGGPIPLLKDNKWMERWDCAVLTSQGQASRAAKDVIDLMGDTDEEITFYCVHDSDGYGTLIYEKLQEASRARPARRVKIINLGLDPAEGRAMGLEVEEFDRKSDAVPVASYIGDRDRDWLQTHRIELDAMTSPQFLAWLDAKMAEHGESPRKVVPTEAVIRQQAAAGAEAILRRRAVEEVLRAQSALIDARVAEDLAALNLNVGAREVERTLDRSPAASWRDAVGAAVASQIDAQPTRAASAQRA